MSFTKYLEDNLEIAEERFILGPLDHEPKRNYNTVQTKEEQVHFVSTKVKESDLKTKGTQCYKNKRIICCNCNEPFIFTEKEQRYYEKHKLCEPKRCPSCRQARKELQKIIKKITEAYHG